MASQFKRPVLGFGLGRVLLGVSPVAVAFVAKLIIDHLAGGMGLGTRLWMLIAIEAGLLAATGWIRYSTQAAQQILRERAWHLLSLKTMGHAAQLDLEFFESPKSHDTLAKAQRELGFRPMLMTFSLLSAAQDLVTVTSFIIVILAFHPLLVLLLLFALLPTLIAARDAGFTNFSTYDMTTHGWSESVVFRYPPNLGPDRKGGSPVQPRPGFLAQRETYAFNVIQARNEAARKKARAFSRGRRRLRIRAIPSLGVRSSSGSHPTHYHWRFHPAGPRAITLTSTALVCTHLPGRTVGAQPILQRPDEIPGLQAENHRS